MIERIFPTPSILSGADLEQELLAPPPEGRLRGKPWVSFNFIASIDGAASMDGVSGKLGNAWDQRIFSLLRQTADVILVGAQTIRVEGYGGQLLSESAQKWRAENWLSEHPPLAIVSGSLNLNPGLEVFTRAPVRPLVLTLESAPQESKNALSKVADLVMVGKDALEVELIISALAERGFKKIHSEGGPTLLNTFAKAGKVDELSLTVSPLLVGGSAGRIAHGADRDSDTSGEGGVPKSQPVASADMTLTRVLKADSMLFLRYVSHDSQQPPAS
ncbi:pyrimidine reductase family protein [Arthrobacter antibioticus]|uniref:pyrimidine reductase family protein n=1 Tax=Arthrobacter sp. H35-MC1 TaxID=3046203 RepID=UPI0024BB4E69|nr:pyrimidine reductase family protein [Arthrobacter sp. H35-MC1]MDJ0316530.1 pyrimidine reductase family protein [Arthrobacter sp. H35-MC1]